MRNSRGGRHRTLIPHAVFDETFLVSRAASAPGLFAKGVRGLTPPGSPGLQLQKRLIQDYVRSMPPNA